VKIAVSVLGRFWAFELAQQMERRGQLAQLMTSLPAFVAKRFGVPGTKIDSYVTLEVARRAWDRMPKPVRGAWNTQSFFNVAYDRFAARNLRSGADLFIGWSGSSLRAMRRAKQFGMTRILERGSSHMLFQQEVLVEQYRAAGLEFRDTHPRVIEQELAEYEEADYIEVPSSFAKRTFIQHGIPEEKLLQIPYGVNLVHFPCGAKRDNVFRVMHCGSLSLRKGLPCLLQAFAELRLPEAELLLVGSVSDEIKPYLERYRDHRIVVPGPQPASQLRHFYSQADVFCLASVEDGFGMVLLQAMACGLPIISTTNTGAADIVREGVEGFVVPINSVEAFKEKILWCYENREQTQEMGRAACKRASAGFTWEDYGQRVAAAYDEIFASRGRKHASEDQYAAVR
jgi:glycosyltransferase involved in cell wall biosynthesis